MARKDDLKMLFNFMIELLKEEETTNVVEAKSNKEILTEEIRGKMAKFDIVDAPRIKTIMDKIDAKQHEDAVIKKALKIQQDSYKKELEDLKEAFNKKTLEQDKLEIEDKKTKFSGGTVYSEFVNKINNLKS
jgi:hypothetical protein